MQANQLSSPIAYSAAWVWRGPGRLERRSWVTVEAGRIREVGKKPPRDALRRDLGQGLLLPGLVNAHTHLELSFLHGHAPTPQGDFVGWLEGMVAMRPGYDREQAKAAALKAARQAARTGTALAGDISNTGRAAWAWREAGVGAVTFIEAVGPARSQPDPPAVEWPGGLLSARAVAAHAPYSVPAGRLRELKALAGSGGGGQGGRLPFCMHCAESRAEVEFIAGQGPEGERMTAFLAARGVHREELGITAPSPLGHLMALGLVDADTLLVHGVQLTRDEMGLLAAAGTSLCLCPRSNLGLTGEIADAQALLAAGVNLALGTDSLTSTPSLDLWAEMRALLDHQPGLDPEAVLTMATQGGARALGLAEHFGGLEAGQVAALCLAPAPGAGQGEVLGAAMAGGGGRVAG